MTPGPISLERFGPAFAEDAEDAADPGNAIDEASVGDSTAEPTVSEADPAVEKADALAHISRTLEIVAAEQAGLRAQCINDAAQALGTAAETLLPKLAQSGYAALVAETAQSIARRGQWPELVLSVAPDAAGEVSASLGGAATGITVNADPALGSGEALLAWSQGGAEIGVEAIAEAALEHFRGRLEACLQQGAR